MLHGKKTLYLYGFLNTQCLNSQKAKKDCPEQGNKLDIRFTDLDNLFPALYVELHISHKRAFMEVHMESITQPKVPEFHVAVDVVALTIKRNLLQVAVVQRKGIQSCIRDPKTGFVREVPREPFDYALPGGHVESQGENLVQAACR